MAKPRSRSGSRPPKHAVAPAPPPIPPASQKVMVTSAAAPNSRRFEDVDRDLEQAKSDARMSLPPPGRRGSGGGSNPLPPSAPFSQVGRRRSTAMSGMPTKDELIDAKRKGNSGVTVSVVAAPCYSSSPAAVKMAAMNGGNDGTSSSSSSPSPVPPTAPFAAAGEGSGSTAEAQRRPSSSSSSSFSSLLNLKRASMGGSFSSNGGGSAGRQAAASAGGGANVENAGCSLPPPPPVSGGASNSNSPSFVASFDGEDVPVYAVVAEAVPDNGDNGAAPNSWSDPAGGRVVAPSGNNNPFMRSRKVMCCVVLALMVIVCLTTVVALQFGGGAGGRDAGAAAGIQGMNADGTRDPPPLEGDDGDGPPPDGVKDEPPPPPNDDGHDGGDGGGGNAAGQVENEGGDGGDPDGSFSFADPDDTLDGGGEAVYVDVDEDDEAIDLGTEEEPFIDFEFDLDGGTEVVDDGGGEDVQLGEDPELDVELYTETPEEDTTVIDNEFDTASAGNLGFGQGHPGQGQGQGQGQGWGQGQDSNCEGPKGKYVGVLLNCDNYGDETYWQINRIEHGTTHDGEVMMDGKGYGKKSSARREFYHRKCLPPGKYRFTIFDEQADGMCCGYGFGSYNVTVGGMNICSGGEFGDKESYEFTVGADHQGQEPAEDNTPDDVDKFGALDEVDLDLDLESGPFDGDVDQNTIQTPAIVIAAPLVGAMEVMPALDVLDFEPVSVTGDDDTLTLDGSTNPFTLTLDLLEDGDFQSESATEPTPTPTETPTNEPTAEPSLSRQPSSTPSTGSILSQDVSPNSTSADTPTDTPSAEPSNIPSGSPSSAPSLSPSSSSEPSGRPSLSMVPTM